MSQAISVAVASKCEHSDCTREPEYAYIVTGSFGKDGVAVYCDRHSEQWADPKSSLTPLTTVS